MHQLRLVFPGLLSSVVRGLRSERNGILPIWIDKGFPFETMEARGSGTVILSDERKQLSIRNPVANKSILQESRGSNIIRWRKTKKPIVRSPTHKQCLKKAMQTQNNRGRLGHSERKEQWNAERWDKHNRLTSWVSLVKFYGWSNLFTQYHVLLNECIGKT